jgi:hypothetical protein
MFNGNPELAQRQFGAHLSVNAVNALVNGVRNSGRPQLGAGRNSKIHLRVSEIPAPLTGGGQ